MAKRKAKDNLMESKDIKLKQEKKEPKPKAVKVDQLHPKVSNKDSLTDNIQSRSSKVAKDAELGKSKKVPLSHKLGLNPKKKK
jgi:hypothetical protein